jgi:hypothetical protein
MKPPKGGVTIRMYRQGLGDCFLLAFGRENQDPFFMLIDCGVIIGTPDPNVKMTAVVDDICKTTKNHLDLLVITHEHWDHVSGFEQAKNSFARLNNQVDRVWLGWTEDPENRLAQQVKAKYHTTARALFALAAQEKTLSSPGMHLVNSLLAFQGPVPPEPNDPELETIPLSAKKTKASNSAARGTGAAMQAAIQLGKRKPKYCQPSDPPIVLEDLPGVKFYVLGPPEDVAAIGREESKREMYFGRQAFSSESAFFSAALGAETGLFEDHFESARLSEPFDRDQMIDDQLVLSTKSKPADSVIALLRQRHAAAVAERAAIDDAWKETAGSIALKLDRGVNNTSLALAVELSPGGKVLVLPGDAQAGNWMGWMKLKWGSGGNFVDMKQLLARTVFYKVAHHGSHNATMKQNGLELMTHSDLQAMIPVDQAMAQQGKGWDMPYPAIFAALESRTKGRILQSAVTKGSAGPTEKVPKGVAASVWKKFRSAVKEGPGKLYWDLTIEG